MKSTFLVVDYGCGAGGIARGYQRAGAHVVGIDIQPQPRFTGDEFFQADMLEVAESIQRSGYWVIPERLRGGGLYGRRVLSREEISLAHLSAPCQRWSKMARCRPELAGKYPDLVTPMRPFLRAAGNPYVIENVEGAPLEDPVMLCMAMFGREMYRHRLLEAGGGITLQQPRHPAHEVPTSRAGHWRPGTYFSMAGHVAPMWKAREVMDIDWMPREEMAEAVPPYVSEWAGLQVRAQSMVRR